MRLEHVLRIYPPKVVITPATRDNFEPKIKVKFTYLVEKDNLDVDVTLFSGTCYMI
jgi:hypothetical protein